MVLECATASSPDWANGNAPDERPTTGKIERRRGVFGRFGSNARLVLPGRTADAVADLVSSLETTPPRTIAGLLGR